MTRIILLTILFTVVFSWDELKQVIRIFILTLFKKRKKLKFVKSQSDKLVSILVTIATLPVALSILALSETNLMLKLLLFAIGLFLVSALSYFSVLFFRTFRAVAPLGILAGGVAPIIGGLAETAYLPRKVLSKFALFLSLAFFAGLALKFSIGENQFRGVISEKLDNLIIVLVGALIIRATIEVFGLYLKRYRFKSLFSYYRVVLGMVLMAVLLFS